METKSCIYCGRALDANLLMEKAGKYRCKDEYNCLDYQTGEDPANSIENADYISHVVKSSLAEAAERIAAYRGAGDDRTKGGAQECVERSEESVAEFTWMKSMLDALALEYKEKPKFAFQYDETKGDEYKILLNDAVEGLYFTVKIDHRNRSGYSLTVAKEEGAVGLCPLYKEFLYKSYPSDRREHVIKDLSVVLIALEEEKGLIPALLNAFRWEIGSGYDKESQ